MRVQRNVIFWHISTLKQYSIYLRYKRSFLCFLVDWLPFSSGYRIIITCGGHSLVLIPCFIESEKGTRDEEVITQLHCTLLDQTCILLFKSMLLSVANGWLARICCTLGVCVASWWPHYVFSCVTRLHCKSVRRWLVGVCVTWVPRLVVAQSCNFSLSSDTSRV